MDHDRKHIPMRDIIMCKAIMSLTKMNLLDYLVIVFVFVFVTWDKSLAVYIELN